MAKNTSFVIGEHFEQFIARQIKSGKFANSSDVVKSALKLLEEQELKVQKLQDEISAGIKSGIAKDFNPQKFKEKMIEKSKSSNE